MLNLSWEKSLDEALFSGEVVPRPQDASHVFEHWGAGGNTGISGQVTGYEGEVGVVTPGL